MVSAEVSDVNLIEDILYIWVNSLTAFKILFGVGGGFWQIIMCLSVDLCEFILLNVFELLRYAGSYIFSNWEVFNHYFCKYFFYFFIFLSLSGTPIMHMLVFLVVSYKSRRFCSFFIIFLIFVLQTRSFYLTYLQLCCFFCLLKITVKPLWLIFYFSYYAITCYITFQPVMGYICDSGSIRL